MDATTLKPTFQKTAASSEPFSMVPPPEGDPTPEEIRQRCLEIQSTWTPAEEAHRRLMLPSDVDGDRFTPAEALDRLTAWHPPGIPRSRSQELPDPE